MIIMHLVSVWHRKDSDCLTRTPAAGLAVEGTWHGFAVYWEQHYPGLSFYEKITFEKKSDFSTYMDNVCGLRGIAGL